MAIGRGSFDLNDLGIRGILLIVAIVCFVLAAIGVEIGTISLTDLGLAFFAGAFLVVR